VATSVNAQPTLLDGEDVPGADMRRALPGAVIPNAGIVRGLKAAALPTPDMKVRLPAGLCMVDDGGGGLCPLYLTTQTDLDIAASSATLARIDSVIAEFVDTGDGATLIRRFRVLTGTPASSPTAPALPPGDQPTAKTLRLANVFVQVNAETNGKVRAQDVSVQATAASLVPRPQQTLQVGNLDNPSPVAGAWTDFTTGQWPRITFTVPASGMAHVTVGAEFNNDHSDASNTRVSFRMSGGYTLASDFGRDAGGHIITSGSRRYLVSGMTPGVSVTVTPTYRLSSLATGTESAYIHSGNMIVEPVA
jgi:hypothetical protein